MFYFGILAWNLESLSETIGLGISYRNLVGVGPLACTASDVSGCILSYLSASTDILYTLPHMPYILVQKLAYYTIYIYTTIYSQEDCHNLQHDLNLLEEWATKWKMTFNLQRCEFLRITNKKYPIFAQYLIQNEIIREITYAKYLGVTSD